jgi:hypothetical protein
MRAMVSCTEVRGVDGAGLLESWAGLCNSERSM